MTQLRAHLDDEAVLRQLRRLTEQLGSPRPILSLMGEILVRSTKDRFAASRAPDGSRWAPNSPSTLTRYADAFSSSRTKTGSRSSAGRRRIAGKKPLIGESRSLGREIHYQVDGASLRVGSTMAYAPTQHFGAKRGAFGRTQRGSPIPWGDIPSREFLGVSDQDRARILDELRALLSRA